MCNALAGYPAFSMSTLESTCPIPGYNPEARPSPAITTIEVIDMHRFEAESFLKIDEIRFISARDVRFSLKNRSQKF